MLLKDIDKAALSGGLLITAAFFFMGFVTYKPHRLARGETFSFSTLFSGYDLYIAAFAITMLLFLTIIKNNRLIVNMGCIFFSNFVIWGILFFNGIAAQEYMALFPTGRVSPALGSWIAILGAYMIILSSLNRVPRKFFIHLGLLLVNGLALWYFIHTPLWSALGILQEFSVRQERFFQEFYIHIKLASSAVGLGIMIGIPLGIAAFQYLKAEKPIFYIVNMVQTFPSLALFGLLIIPLASLAETFPYLRSIGIGGIGWAPALIALTLYSLLPITRNTYSSIKSLDPTFIEAAKGMGMNKKQILHRVQIPLALPIILGGVRTASVQTIGNTAVAALIGAGGLGTFIFQGLGQAAPDLILLGALPIIALAIFTDTFMKFLIYLLVAPVFRGEEH